MAAPLADWASSSHLAGQWTELLAFFSFTDFRHFLPYGSLPARLSLPSSLTLPPLCFKKKQKHPATVQESEKGVSEACFWSTLFLLVSAEESVWTVTRTGLWLPETWSGGPTFDSHLLYRQVTLLFCGLGEEAHPYHAEKSRSFSGSALFCEFLPPLLFLLVFSVCLMPPAFNKWQHLLAYFPGFCIYILWQYFNWF